MSAGTDLAAEIAAALAEAGEAVGDGPLVGTIKRRGAKSGPDYAPTYGPDTEHTFTVVLGTFSDREREGTSILATDAKITASTSDIVPTVTDRIVIGSKTYEVYGVTPLNPGGVDLMYEIWARA